MVPCSVLDFENDFIGCSFGGYLAESGQNLVSGSLLIESRRVRGSFAFSRKWHGVWGCQEGRIHFAHLRCSLVQIK